MKIAIVDYGMGNLHSIKGALEYCGCQSISITKSEKELLNADKILLPGVGNFAKAITTITNEGLDKILSDLIIIKKKPILGICLGMQLLGKSSTESGYSSGLGFVDGIVERFDDSGLKVPHVGFNQVSFKDKSRLYSGLQENPDFYFTHSYRMMSDTEIGQATCEYGTRFVASFECENIAGTQFHPELSQTNGIHLLRNFLEKF